MNYIYDGKFEGNILVAGRTGCGKTTFAQNLAQNKMFGSLKEVIWTSKILLSKEREDQIRKYFLDEKVDFKHAETIDGFDNLLEHLQKKKISCNEKSWWENIELDRLIILGNVSVLVDWSEIFANFLTVSRKFGMTFVHVFHTIYSTRQNWQMILAQAKTNDIFPGSLQISSILKILSSFCSRYKYNYIPGRDLWINGLYFNASNSSKKKYLIIDTRAVNELGPAKFRTHADNNS